MHCVLLRALLVSMLAVTIAHGQGDPFTGTWKLNLAKSRYITGTPPKGEIAIFRVSGNEEYLKAETENADGSRSATEYTARFDGKEYAVTDVATGKRTSGVALKRIDPWHEERYRMQEGKKTGTLRREVSKDGKVLTSTVFNAGGTITSILVFDKQ